MIGLGSGKEGWEKSGRNKLMADGVSKSLKLCLKPAMESSGCLMVEEEEDDCPGKMAGRKAPPVQIRDETGISIACAWLSLTDEERPLLGVSVLSRAP